MLDLHAKAPMNSGKRESKRPVEKLVEYRSAHYAAHSEAASYFTNTPARVQFRFANPIICELKTGRKVMRVGGGKPFEFFPGDAMFVPPGMEIDVDLGAANATRPIECDCVEIETGRMNGILARLNESLSHGGHDSNVAIDWSAYSVVRRHEARQLDFGGLMARFRQARDMFTDLRIDTKIDETLLTLLQIRQRDMLSIENGKADSGVHAAARMIR